MGKEADDCEGAYDRVADEYAARIAGELVHKPFDRALLDRFAEQVKAAGLVADVGCGPGHVARYLRERGVQVCGVDLSAEMLEQARRLNPGVDFIKADMRALPVPAAAWVGALAFYSLIHIRPADLAGVLRELRRAIRPGGPLLLGFHEGDQVLRLDQWWDRKVSVDFFFYQAEDMRRRLEQVGYDVVEVLQRPPYAPQVEHQSQRCYILARA